VSTNQQAVSEISTMIEINRKTSYMIRSVLFIIILFAIAVVYLSWSQNKDMQKMSQNMSGLTKNVAVMSDAIVKMQSSMSEVGSGINKVVSHTQFISHSVSQKEMPVETLIQISDTVKLMQKDAHSLGKSMESVNYNLDNISKQMKKLNRKLGTIAQDTNRMPSPTRMFPF